MENVTKKRLIIFFVVLAAICLTFVIAKTAHKPSIPTTESIIAEISNVIYEYYYDKDTSGSFGTSNFLERDIGLYLVDKVETQQHVNKTKNLTKENYNLEVNLIDSAQSEDSDFIDFEIQALAVYNYVGSDFDTTVSDTVYVKYDVKKQKVVNVFVLLDYYDEFVRADESKGIGFNNAGEFELTPDIVAKQKELHRSIGM